MEGIRPLRGRSEMRTVTNNEINKVLTAVRPCKKLTFSANQVNCMFVYVLVKLFLL